MGSSSHDQIMLAAPATIGGGALSTATGMVNPQTGYIPISEEYKALKEWANNYREQTERDNSLAKAQMQHLIGVISESKRESNLMRTELENVKETMNTEVSVSNSKLKELWNSCEATTAFKEAQHSKQLSDCQSEAQVTQTQLQNTNTQLLHEYTTTCRNLDLAQTQLSHLAERANQAALAYEFKDDELKRNALHNEKLIASMNEKADVDKNELERRLQHSYGQCQDIVNRANQSQKQAYDKIELIIEANQQEKDWMVCEMQAFTQQGGADEQKLAFYEGHYAQAQAAFTKLQTAETEGRQENIALQNSLEWTQAQFKYGEEEVSVLW